jgi:transposase
MITFLNGNLEPVESDPTKQRRRRWSRQQKAAIVAETYRPNMSVPLVADRYNIAPTQLLTWRRLFTQPTTSTAVGATTDDPVVPSRSTARSSSRFTNCNDYWVKKSWKTSICAPSCTRPNQRHPSCRPRFSNPSLCCRAGIVHERHHAFCFGAALVRHIPISII